MRRRGEQSRAEQSRATVSVGEHRHRSHVLTSHASPVGIPQHLKHGLQALGKLQ
jgi:hypothetical protein